MNVSKKHLAVYAVLLLAWPLVVLWLVFDHHRVARLAHDGLLNRARDISNTIAVVSRQGGPGVIRESHLRNVLNELTRSSELLSVALLNAEGEVVVAAGQPLELRISELPRQGTQWEKNRVTVVNLVDFGLVTDSEGTTRPMTIVIPSRDERTTASRFGRPFPPPPAPPGSERDPDRPSESADERPRFRDLFRDRADRTSSTTQTAERREFRRSRERREIFHRPPWMSQTRYEELLREQGLHGFVIVLSTDRMQNEIGRDFWLRVILGGIALIAVGGVLLAWLGTDRSTRLQLRLIRAHELTAHLQEMNVAAAGLAHETRNPLNIVRGLAQMIERRDDLPDDIRERSRHITEEVDRVTSRLNEFISYSRPPEPRPVAMQLLPVIHDVARALESDCEDKHVHLAVEGAPVTIQADESLLRQVLFNLLLNAIQAVNIGGRVRTVVSVGTGNEVTISVEDDGPGVAAGIRDEVFRPYFTTHEQGSGLGLAVVRQIVLAHGWEIAILSNTPHGAVFRISGLKTS